LDALTERQNRSGVHQERFDKQRRPYGRRFGFLPIVIEFSIKDGWLGGKGRLSLAKPSLPKANLGSIVACSITPMECGEPNPNAMKEEE
jgi:hypothetical protein